MPRLNRKRRSDAISRDPSPSPSESPEPQQSTQRRVRRRGSDASQTSASSVAFNALESHADNQRKNLVKKLVRLALASEYSRLPLRRSDISAKVFKDSAGGASNSGSSFKKVFEDAQSVLRQTFGMELQELPTKEKTGLNERRKQATQPQKSASASNRSWILVSVLPKQFRQDRRILAPEQTSIQEVEAGYVAFYTVIIAFIYLKNGEVTEQQLERHLKRMNADRQTPFGSWEKVKARLLKENYLDRKKDSSGGEEVTTYTVGPRGKTEVGAKGVEGLVKSVYGLGAAGPGPDGPKMELEELEKRLKRSLGAHNLTAEGADVAGSNRGSATQSRNGTPQPQQPAASQQPRRGRRRAARDDDDDDD